MKADIRLRPEAELDIEEAALWYENQRPGLGQEFLDEVLATLSSIGEGPLLYPELHRSTRRAVVHRFPFLQDFLFDNHRDCRDARKPKSEALERTNLDEVAACSSETLRNPSCLTPSSQLTQ